MSKLPPAPQLDELGVPLRFFPLLPRQNLVNLAQYEYGAAAIELRRHRRILSIKLVKPIKTVSSWTPHDGSVDHFLLSETKTHIRTCAARILGEPDPAVGRKVGRFDPTDRALHQAAKLLTLFLRDRGAQVLNLDQAFADENHLGHFRNASDPRVADQLRIQGKQSFRLFWVPAGRRLPLE